MSFEPWVSLSTWESYLSDKPENLELPVNSLAPRAFYLSSTG